MSTKKCEKCGWEYPANWPGRTCRFCGGKVPNNYCCICKQLAPSLNSLYVCAKCQTKYFNRWKEKRNRTAEEKYEKYLELIKSIPTPYKTLTEEQWMEACKHFGGCAYCGADEIASRSMFITFKEGGRYCAWNIVPVCERCEVSNKIQPNPFKRFDRVVHRGKAEHAVRYNLSLDKLQKIVDYLTSKMEVNNNAE